MQTKTKTFDCVEMKNRIQAQLLAEYERRKGEFSSFGEFVKARNAGNEWVCKVRTKFTDGK